MHVGHNIYMIYICTLLIINSLTKQYTAIILYYVYDITLCIPLCAAQNIFPSLVLRLFVDQSRVMYDNSYTDVAILTSDLFWTTIGKTVSVWVSKGHRTFSWMTSSSIWAVSSMHTISEIQQSAQLVRFSSLWNLLQALQRNKHEPPSKIILLCSMIMWHWLKLTE